MKKNKQSPMTSFEELAQSDAVKSMGFDYKKITKEEKQLLLKDLCARLPYKVIVEIVSYTDETSRPWFGELSCKDLDCFIHDVAYESIKPYLRPMSSMTEEEQEDYFNICNEDIETLSKAMYAPDIIISDRGRTQGYIAHKELEWLYEHHFDFIRKVGDEYKTLTELGLAIEAPNDMYEKI